MPRQAKSQWDFGELFSAEQTRRVLTVTELTLRIKGLIEQSLGTLWVTGELTNLRQQSSGHMYFTLKDASTQVACVLFRGERVAHRELLEDGQKVILRGDVTVYEARGQYQLIVRQVELQGVGALQAAFEKLKQKLAAEGLFDEERKRPLPPYPQRLGIVTSPTGAALKDVLHVVARRNPALQIVLAPCRVQGAGAAEEIAGAIQLLNAFAATAPVPGAAQAGSGLDAILVTRGGGSLEDLWAFNEEVVARAIAASVVPVVSAVGHEIDFTISDFVADLRAATPSAAAEVLTEGVLTGSRFLEAVPERLLRSAMDGIADAKEGWKSLLGRMTRAHPRRRLNEVTQRVDDLHSAFSRAMREALNRARVDQSHLAARFTRCRPHAQVSEARVAVERQKARLAELARRLLQAAADRVSAASARLRLLGPEQVLERGYSITTDEVTGKLIRSSTQTRVGQRLRTRLSEGAVNSRVEG